ncbi:MAG TPA: glycoside hydrolase family 28 protein [Vicinamibacterales bacterium]|nr:glycoside hydrolase family 28 protein [Vicinamibacterales bacterium]
MPSRRSFLRTAGSAAASLVIARRVLTAPVSSRPQTATQDVIWKRADEILARIVPPRFPSREFPVTRFGAVPDGTTDCTDAIRKAITACHSAGGGHVTIPAGRFATGAIHLKSRVNLHVSEGATLLFSRDSRSYLPLVFTRFEGVELMNYSPLIYAFEQEDVAVTGGGTLDGQAGERYWWPWKGAWSGHSAREGAPTQAAARGRLFEMAQRGVPVAQRTFGDGGFLRPNFIQPYRCKNVLIEGVRIVNSPMWEIHPVLCTNVTVRGVTIVSHGPNNDGCDPESCRDVLIEKCTFDTGDDCIAIKSGRNEDGRRVNAPVENVIVRDCVMRDGHGGVVIGSEVSGGARNIFAERCQMDSPRLDRALRIKSNSVRGGFVEHVYMRNVAVGQVAEAVLTVDLFYEEGDTGKFPPTIRDIEVRDVTSKKSEYVLLLRGYAHTPLTDIRVLDCTFDNVAKPDVTEAVKGLRLSNVRVNGQVRTETIDR